MQCGVGGVVPDLDLDLRINEMASLDLLRERVENCLKALSNLHSSFEQ